MLLATISCVLADNNIPEYTIDLNLPEEDRYTNVTTDFKDDIIASYFEYFKRIPSWADTTFNYIYPIYYASHHE